MANPGVFPSHYSRGNRPFAVLADKNDDPEERFPRVVPISGSVREERVYGASPAKKRRGYGDCHAKTNDNYDAFDDRIFCLLFSPRSFPILEHIYHFWYNPTVSSK